MIVTMERIMAGCNRNSHDLLNEIRDRIDYMCLRTDGTYDIPLPAECPQMVDIMRMVIRLSERVKEENRND